MSFDDLKVIDGQRPLSSIATGQSVGSTIADAVVAAEIVDALAESVAHRRWVTIRLGRRSAGKSGSARTGHLRPDSGERTRCIGRFRLGP